jgi:hypothetical protein
MMLTLCSLHDCVRAAFNCAMTPVLTSTAHTSMPPHASTAHSPYLSSRHDGRGEEFCCSQKRTACHCQGSGPGLWRENAKKGLGFAEELFWNKGWGRTCHVVESGVGVGSSKSHIRHLRGSSTRLMQKNSNNVRGGCKHHCAVGDAGSDQIEAEGRHALRVV